MEAFLTASKACLANLKDYQRVRVILGNPTCDLDSAVCALAKGFLAFNEQQQHHHHQQQKEPARVCGFVPVLNVTRDVFRVKTEVSYYLRRCGVPRDLLTFRNEIDLHALHAAGKLDLVLVDHHALTGEDVDMAKSVTEVIDHRPQDPNWPWTGLRMSLKIVGSCASLVAREILDERSDIMPIVADLLMGPILIDTVNFSKEAARATPLDHEIICQLDRICGTDATKREKLYCEILEAKTDISELTPGDLLIKDLKVVDGVPIPGFPMLVKDFIELDGAGEALEAFRLGHGSQLVVLIGMRLKRDSVTRDIGVYSLMKEDDDDRAANKLIEALTSSTSPDLQLKEVKLSSDKVGDSSRQKSSVRLYEQNNLRATRKQILPIVQAALTTAT